MLIPSPGGLPVLYRSAALISLVSSLVAHICPKLAETGLFLFAARPSFGQYFRSHFLDTTFRGLYQANAFDLALLIPYFIVLIWLASYGIHRYTLV